MPTRCRGLFAAVIAVFLATPLILPAPASAQTSGAYLDGAEPWTESDCAGDTPIVVGADAKAQSDIYSAVTLAGVLDTDCVILAGPRDGDMPAEQRARLEAAEPGGYVVGGTAAVPEAKIAGRDMTRLGGATRWATARVVGQSASGDTTTGTPDTTLAAPADVAAPGLYLGGAEPWIASDCAGDTPIVVGADSKAQSDIYSAVTLAGVIGTDCVILAGPRTGDTPASQRARLGAAEPGGYVLGGIAAVPTAKIAGRGMTRLGGATRWATAQLVGRRASGDTTAGTNTATETTEPGETGMTDGASSGSFIAVSAGSTHSCGLRSDGTVTCWGSNTDRNGNEAGQTDAPAGSFTTVSAGALYSCALRTDRTVTCWGKTEGSEVGEPPPEFASLGSFSAVSAGSYGCGLRTDATVICWGQTGEGWRDGGTPSGSFTAVSTGGNHVCGLRTDGSVICWGGNPFGQAEGQSDAPSGSFTAVSAGGSHSCGLRTDGNVTCWGAEWEEFNQGQADAPPGSFTAVSAGGAHSCGVLSDATVTCWGWNDDGQADAPSGSFTAVSAGSTHSCGLRTDGTVTCWGYNGDGQAVAPS